MDRGEGRRERHREDPRVGRRNGRRGTGRGYTGISGLNALLATIPAPLSVPVIDATRLRQGATNSVRGAAKVLADALATVRRAVLAGWSSCARTWHSTAMTSRPAAGPVLGHRHTPTATRAITAIGEQAWVPIRCPNAIFDDVELRWISDAEVAEIEFTAFTNRRKSQHVTARLIVRQAAGCR